MLFTCKSSYIYLKKIVKQKRLKKIRSQEIMKRQTSFTYNTSGRFLDKTHWQIPCHHNDQSDSSVLRPGKHSHQYPYIPWDLEIIVNIRTIVRIPRERFILLFDILASQGFSGSGVDRKPLVCEDVCSKEKH